MNSKKFMIISITILVIAIVGASGTYAWIKYNSTEQAKINLGVCTPTIDFDGGNTIVGENLKPVLDKNDGIIKDISISVNKTCDRTVTSNLSLKVDKLDAGLKDSTFVYELYFNSTQGYILAKKGNFSTVNEGDIITLFSNKTVTTVTSKYKLFIYLDGNQVNKSTTQGQSFKFSLYGSGDNAVSNNASVYIRNLYDNANTTSVVNNGITYYYDTTHNLMKDIAGGTRYYGASPNNYIYFNCTDYSNQSADTCEVWRIIGVFDDKIKIIRNEPLGILAWDLQKNVNPSSTGYSNNWETASLRILLNGKYYDRGDTESITYYSGKSNTAAGMKTTVLDLMKVGINNATRTLISKSTWFLGGTGHVVEVKYSDVLYKKERGTNVYGNYITSIEDYIALMYPSDFGYAIDFSKCNGNLSENNSEYNWLVLKNNTVSEYLLTHIVTNTESVTYLMYFSVYKGELGNGGVQNNYLSRPTLYLNSDVRFKEGVGDGSESSPYQIEIN